METRPLLSWKNRRRDVNDAAEGAVTPLVSVIMPVRNGAAFLAESINSILAQTLTDFELLIVYDKSEDNSEAIIDSYRMKDSRVKVVCGNGEGLIDALNCGISAAKATYIARMDADDLSFPERFAKQVALMEKEEADICGGHYFIIDENGHYLDARIVPLTQESIIVTLAQTVPFAHGSVMIRRSFLEANMIRYGEKKEYAFAEDYSMWATMFELGARFANVNAWIFSYRDYGHSVSKRKTNQVARDRRGIAIEFISANRGPLAAAAIALLSRRKTVEEMESMALLAFILAVRFGRFEVIRVVRALGLRAILIGFVRGARLLLLRFSPSHVT